MNHPPTMQIDQPVRDIFELSDAISDSYYAAKIGFTSSNRFASQCSLANSLISPFSIHSNTVAYWPSFIIAPRRGSTFGWRKEFHVTTSLQNRCTCRHQLVDSRSCKTNLRFNPIYVGGWVNLEYFDRDMAKLVFPTPPVSELAGVQ